jgi:hypothetical protein
MTLPRFNSRCLFSTAVPVVALAMLVTMLPARVHAAAQELSCSPASLTYGNVTVNQTETLLVAVTNNGKVSVTISSVDASSSKFKVSKLKLPLVLAAGESLELSVTFAPTATGAVNGQVTFASNATNRTLNLAVGGAGVTSEAVTASPASVSFGSVAMGGTSTLPVVLTNTRSQQVILTSLQTTGGSFSVSGAKFPLTLAAGEKVKLDATFKPEEVGLTGGSSFVSGPALNIPFEGTGSSPSKPKLTISPDALSFGNVALGTTETRTLGLSASGGNVIISSVSSSSSLFAVPGEEFPLTIPEGHGVSLNVTFKPQHSGTASATLSFTSNAENSPTHEAVSGTGTVPYVSLSWSASTSPEVKGYNIYRNTSPNGSYVKINSKLDPDTNYNDSTVVGGKTYYYATTAVNSSGKESSYSNKVEVVVP